MSNTINTGIDISNLSPNTQYTYILYPINKNDQTSSSTTLSFTTKPKINSLSLNSIVSDTQINVNIDGAFNYIKPYYSSDGGVHITI